MEVEIKLEPGRNEPKLIILTGEMTAAISDLARRLTTGELRFLPGYRDGEVLLLDPNQVRRIWAEEQTVLARTESATVTLKMRLYELEERLDPADFVRISHSEIVNLRQVTALDLSLAGTIKMTLAGGAVICWVSRRYVPKIKEGLGLRRRGTL